MVDSVTVAPSPFLLNTSTRATVYLPTMPISQCSTRIVEVNHAPFTSAVTGSTSSSANNSHVVTIQISQNNDIQLQKELFDARKIDGKVTVSLNDTCDNLSNFKLSSNHTADDTTGEMVQQPHSDLEVNKSSNLFYIPSGQCSPSSTMDMDSGTCSDMETTPPPLPKKISAKNKGTALKYTTGHIRRGSFTDSEESESSLSSDSLNSGDIIVVNKMSNPPIRMTPMTTLNDFDKDNVDNESTKLICLPDSLLRDIRDRSTKLSASEIINMTKSEQNGSANNNNKSVVYSRVKIKTGTTSAQDFVTQDTYQNSKIYENDKFYKFHINESVLNVIDEISPQNIQADESFAGYKDINNRTSTIRSSKGTVRGVKNRVRNGIATFLQMQQSNVKVSALFSCLTIKYYICSVVGSTSTKMYNQIF